MLEKFQLVYLTVDQLIKCVILSFASAYITSPEKKAAIKSECLNFIEKCQPFHLAMQKEKLPANNNALVIVLDIAISAKECAKNEDAFDDTARLVVQTSSGILTESVKKLAIELDNYSK